MAGTSTDWTVKETQRPSGEICGSLIRFNSIMAEASNGDFWAKAMAAEARVRRRLRRIPRLWHGGRGAGGTARRRNQG